MRADPLGRSTRPTAALAVGLVLSLTAGVACDAQAAREAFIGAPTVHTVTLGGRGADEHVVPTRMIIRRGDLVQFTSVDRRIHTITFLLDELSPGGRAFLEETGQTRSPPLMERGTTFTVAFREAPLGFYPFVSEAHGAAVRGVIVVE
jgi:plastocyanin